MDGTRKYLGVALALVAGGAIAVQARVNSSLAAEIGDVVLAALISFAGGLLLLLGALALLPGMRAGTARLSASLAKGELRRWHLLGGFGGAGFVASQAGTVGVLGVAVFTVGVVTGQTASGLVVDKLGLGPAGKRKLTTARVLGASLMFVAVLLIMSDGITNAGSGLWLLVFPLLGGFAVAVQQAINGRVGAAARSPLVATLVNFSVGTTVLAIAWLVTLAVRGLPGGELPHPLLYTGGLVGVTFIALAALVVRWIGVLVLGLATIAGQLTASLLIDLLYPAHPGVVSPSTIAGVALAFVAIAVAVSGTFRRARSPWWVRS